jgi:hypothetical protein
MSQESCKSTQEENGQAQMYRWTKKLKKKIRKKNLEKTNWEN